MCLYVVAVNKKVYLNLWPHLLPSRQGNQLTPRFLFTNHKTGAVRHWKHQQNANHRRALIFQTQSNSITKDTDWKATHITLPNKTHEFISLKLWTWISTEEMWLNLQDNLPLKPRLTKLNSRTQCCWFHRVSEQLRLKATSKSPRSTPAAMSEVVNHYIRH